MYTTTQFHYSCKRSAVHLTRKSPTKRPQLFCQKIFELGFEGGISRVRLKCGKSLRTSPKDRALLTLSQCDHRTGAKHRLTVRLAQLKFDHRLAGPAFNQFNQYRPSSASWAPTKLHQEDITTDHILLPLGLNCYSALSIHAHGGPAPPQEELVRPKQL